MRKIVRCAICNVEKTFTSLAIHVWNKHRIKKFDYAVKFLGHSKTPLCCKCGCGKVLKWKSFERGWGDFILGHNKSRLGQLVPQEVRSKISDTLKTKYQTGELISLNKGKTKENCEYIRRATEKLIGRSLSLEHKKTISETLKQEYESGEITIWNKGKTKNDDPRLMTVSKKLENKIVPDDQKLKISEKVKYLHANTDIYKNNSEVSRNNAIKQAERNGLWAQTDEGKLELSRLMKIKNSEGKMLIGREDLPTSPEIKVMSWFKDELVYTGKGTFWITCNKKHKNPDFISRHYKRKVVEVFGDYYHHYDDKLKNDYLETMKGYKSIGYECLIVWEHEINKEPEIVKEKIRRFLKI